VTEVHFDRELRRLEPDDAAAWRAWLTQHQLDHMLIACPSVLTYRPPTKRKPSATVTVELLTRDPQGAYRSKKTVNFSGSLLPFPSGYRVTRQESAQRRTQAKKPSERARVPESAGIA
jgi:hypothetical protein